MPSRVQAIQLAGPSDRVTPSESGLCHLPRVRRVRHALPPLFQDHRQVRPQPCFSLRQDPPGAPKPTRPVPELPRPNPPRVREDPRPRHRAPRRRSQARPKRRREVEGRVRQNPEKLRNLRIPRHQALNLDSYPSGIRRLGLRRWPETESGVDHKRSDSGLGSTLLAERAGGGARGDREASSDRQGRRGHAGDEQGRAGGAESRRGGAG